MYLIHEPDPDTPLNGTLQALDAVVRMGKVIYVGASNIEAWRDSPPSARSPAGG
jgi:aryl-alcohol dehydrogenase (NADP+)